MKKIMKSMVKINVKRAVILFILTFSQGIISPDLDPKQLQALQVLGNRFTPLTNSEVTTAMAIGAALMTNIANATTSDLASLIDSLSNLSTIIGATNQTQINSWVVTAKSTIGVASSGTSVVVPSGGAGTVTTSSNPTFLDQINAASTLILQFRYQQATTSDKSNVINALQGIVNNIGSSFPEELSQVNGLITQATVIVFRNQPDQTSQAALQGFSAAVSTAAAGLSYEVRLASLEGYYNVFTAITQAASARIMRRLTDLYNNRSQATVAQTNRLYTLMQFLKPQFFSNDAKSSATIDGYLQSVQYVNSPTQASSGTAVQGGLAPDYDDLIASVGKSVSALRGNQSVDESIKGPIFNILQQLYNQRALGLTEDFSRLQAVMLSAQKILFFNEMNSSTLASVSNSAYIPQPASGSVPVVPITSGRGALLEQWRQNLTSISLVDRLAAAESIEQNPNLSANGKSRFSQLIQLLIGSLNQMTREQNNKLRDVIDWSLYNVFYAGDWQQTFTNYLNQVPLRTTASDASGQTGITSKDTPRDGTYIAIAYVPSGSTLSNGAKFLQVSLASDGKTYFIKPTGKTLTDPSCQFKIYRNVERMGLGSSFNGNFVVTAPASGEPNAGGILCSATPFDATNDGMQFMMIGSIGAAAFLNVKTGGFMTYLVGDELRTLTPDGALQPYGIGADKITFQTGIDQMFQVVVLSQIHTSLAAASGLPDSGRIASYQALSTQMTRATPDEIGAYVNALTLYVQQLTTTSDSWTQFKSSGQQPNLQALIASLSSNPVFSLYIPQFATLTQLLVVGAVIIPYATQITQLANQVLTIPPAGASAFMVTLDKLVNARYGTTSVDQAAMATNKQSLLNLLALIKNAPAFNSFGGQLDGYSQAIQTGGLGALAGQPFSNQIAAVRNRVYDVWNTPSAQPAFIEMLTALVQSRYGTGSADQVQATIDSNKTALIQLLQWLLLITQFSNYFSVINGLLNAVTQNTTYTPPATTGQSSSTGGAQQATTQQTTTQSTNSAPTSSANTTWASLTEAQPYAARLAALKSEMAQVVSLGDAVGFISRVQSVVGSKYGAFSGDSSVVASNTQTLLNLLRSIYYDTQWRFISLYETVESLGASVNGTDFSAVTLSTWTSFSDGLAFFNQSLVSVSTDEQREAYLMLFTLFLTYYANQNRSDRAPSDQTNITAIFNNALQDTTRFGGFYHDRLVFMNKLFLSTSGLNQADSISKSFAVLQAVYTMQSRNTNMTTFGVATSRAFITESNALAYAASNLSSDQVALFAKILNWALSCGYFKSTDLDSIKSALNSLASVNQAVVAAATAATSASGGTVAPTTNKAVANAQKYLGVGSVRRMR